MALTSQCVSDVCFKILKHKHLLQFIFFCRVHHLVDVDMTRQTCKTFLAEWQTFQYDVLVLYKLCMLVSNGLCTTYTNLWTSVFCMVCCKSAAAVAAPGATTGCSRLGFVTYNLQILNLISFFCFRISPIILNDCATTYIHVHACLPLILFVSGILYFAVKIHCTINRFIIVVYGQCEKAVSGW